MKFPFLSLTRRQAFAGVAAAATTATTPVTAASSGQIRKEAALLTLKKSSAKELLLKMALTSDHVFAVWSTAIARGSSRLACYGLDGETKWSKDLGTVPVFAVLASGDNEATTVVIDKEAAKLVFSTYTSQGPLNQEDQLPLNTAVLAAGANSTDICALDVATSLVSKRFRSPEGATQIPAAFDNPTIGGVKLRAIMASVHFLGNQLLLLDHVQARTVSILPNGERRSGRLVHASIDAAIRKQDEDVASRASLLRSSGNEHTLTFPTSISFAASDRANALWIISSLETGSIPIYRLNPDLLVTETYSVQIPAGSVVADRPPLMLAASQSRLALGFREGVVAVVDHKTA